MGCTLNSRRWGLLALLLACAAAAVVGARLRPRPAADTRARSVPTDHTPSRAAPQGGPQGQALAGSRSCRECHERFYELWSTSHHGLAMQPYTAALARQALVPQEADVVVGAYRYRAEVAADAGWVREQGPDGEKIYPIQHVMGGKNVYFFLTPLERGRLQVLPVAYDVGEKTWYDTTASMVRHLGEPARGSHPLDRPAADLQYLLLQLPRQPARDQLRSQDRHLPDRLGGTRASAARPATGHPPSTSGCCRAAPEGEPPADLKILRYERADHRAEQHLLRALPRQRHADQHAFHARRGFFDHSDLVTYEHADYYPDGRDLGENYTYTSWLESPCVQAGKLTACIAIPPAAATVSQDRPRPTTRACRATRSASTNADATSPPPRRQARAAAASTATCR